MFVSDMRKYLFIAAALAALFSCEKEAGVGLAFQCLGINTIEGNAPTCDKFIFESRSPVYLVDFIAEDICHAVQLLLVQVHPSIGTSCTETLLEQIIPKSTGQAQRTVIG